MALPIPYASGSTLVVVGVENFLSSPNVVGTFYFYIDSNPLVAGDVLEVRQYKMVRAVAQREWNISSLTTAYNQPTIRLNVSGRFPILWVTLPH